MNFSAPICVVDKSISESAFPFINAELACLASNVFFQDWLIALAAGETTADSLTNSISIRDNRIKVLVKCVPKNYTSSERVVSVVTVKSEVFKCSIIGEEV